MARTLVSGEKASDAADYEGVPHMPVSGGMVGDNIEQNDAARIAYLVKRYDASLREISHSKSIIARAFRELRFINERVKYFGGQDGVLTYKGRAVDTTNLRHLNDALSALARQMRTRHELEATLEDEGLRHLIHPLESPLYERRSDRFR